MVQQHDVSRSTAAFVPDETLVVVVEMSRSTWLVAGLLPGVVRRPLKKLDADENSDARAGARKLSLPVGGSHVPWLPCAFIAKT